MSSPHKPHVDSDFIEPIASGLVLMTVACKCNVASNDDAGHPSVR